MPIYEYRCRSCGQTIEAMQRMSDRPLRKCRKCSGKLEKLISRTSFALKGGGWYSEGYNKNGKSKKSQSDPKPAKDAKAAKAAKTVDSSAA
jgi:putative FmdB family regulatory protein